ncbi:EpsD family peptidyl-prolyl cis-trans isomerase [Rhodoferax sp. GW822-FHT02A01]|uniref:EpsD family peptidyl-prolyl cis-trans isomerase n=1 Tax=Rhodoferax sp. GW822-FHT02A01 TaxID=3141537 RepID=UPI00315D9831
MAVSLVACGQKDDKKVATQVAAKVGDEEISVHQINQVLNSAKTSGATPQAVQAMSREVLEKLIDQQLAIEQSNEKKLNRSPEVVAQIESAKREILARAYIQQLVSGLPKPTQEEIKQYYTEHPQLFSERRVFNLQELIVPAQAGIAEQLGTLVNAGKPMEEIANWLKAHDVKYSGGGATRAAEQIPMELLNRLQKLKDGQSLVAQTPQAITLIHIVASKTVPADEADSLPRIAQFLSNQRASEAVAANMKALRKSAKIEYMGEFAKTDAAAAPTPASAVSAPAVSAEDQKRADLEKGVAGLK